MHHVTELGTHELPRVAVDQPVVGLFNLAAVHNTLTEHAVLVANPISNARQPYGRDGIEKTGRQPSQATIAKRSIGLDFNQGVEISTQLLTGLLAGVIHVGGEHRIDECTTGQKFHRQVVHPLGVLILCALERVTPRVHDVITNRVENSEHPVALGG